MIEYFKKILCLPDECIIEKAMPKVYFEHNFKLTTAERKMLKMAYLPERITWLASIKPANTGIPTYETNEVSYIELQVFVIQLMTPHKEAYATRLANLIHKYIPYHSLVIVSDQQQYQASGSRQVINKADQQKRVLEDVYEGPWYSLVLPSLEQKKTEGSICFSTINKANLQQMYDAYTGAIIKARAHEVLQNTPSSENSEELWQQIRAAKTAELEMKAIKEKIKKAKTISERVQLQMQLQVLKKSI